MVCRLKDIADAMSVSVNTVSRALNDKDSVSEELRERIKQKAAEMGYVTNLSASSLRTGQSKTVAIVYDNFFNPYYAIVTGLLQRKLFSRQYGAFIFSEGRNAYLTAGMVKQMLARGIDGIISFIEPEREAVELINVSGKKLVLIGRKMRGDNIDFISPDDVAGAYAAVKHIIDCGHKNILMISAKKEHPCTKDRSAGYLKAMREAGLDGLCRILYIGTDGSNAREIIDVAENRNIEYSAVFCFNDMMAFAVMSRLSEIGKSVPDKVSVVGYDHIESNLSLPISLTTVDANKELMAEIAVKKIIAMLEGGEECTDLLPKPELFGGKTVKILGE